MGGIVGRYIGAKSQVQRYVRKVGSGSWWYCNEVHRY
jgi:hypothetical protein